MRPMTNERPITRNIVITAAIVRVGDDDKEQSVELVGAMNEKQVSARLRRDFGREDIWCTAVSVSVRKYSMDIYDFIENDKVNFTDLEN